MDKYYRENPEIGGKHHFPVTYLPTEESWGVCWQMVMPFLPALWEGLFMGGNTGRMMHEAHDWEYTKEIIAEERKAFQIARAKLEQERTALLRQNAHTPSPFGGPSANVSSDPASYGLFLSIVGNGKGWEADCDGLPIYTHKIFGAKVAGSVIYTIAYLGSEMFGVEPVQKTAWEIVKSLGAITAKLHIVCLAYAFAEKASRQFFRVGRKELYKLLGLEHKTDMTRADKDKKCFEEIEKLSSFLTRSLRIYPTQKTKKKLNFKISEEDRAGPFWNLKIERKGQGYISQGGERGLEWEEWSLVGQPGMWAKHFLYDGGEWQTFARMIKEQISKTSYKSNWGMILAMELAFRLRMRGGGITNQKIIELCGGETYPDNPKAQYETKQRVELALEYQEVWGATPNYSSWPETLRPDGENRKPKLPTGYWSAWLTCNTTFDLPESLKTPLTKAKLPAPKALPAPEKKEWAEWEIKELRERRCWTQKQMGEVLGVGRALVSLIEGGKRKIKPKHNKILSKIEG